MPRGTPLRNIAAGRQPLGTMANSSSAPSAATMSATNNGARHRRRVSEMNFIPMNLANPYPATWPITSALFSPTAPPNHDAPS
jgi:hypothetical protein